MNQKSFASIVLITVIIVLVGIVGYITLIKKPANLPNKQVQPYLPSTQQQVIPPATNNISPQTPPSETANWKTYTSSQLGLSLKYPPYLNLQVHPVYYPGYKETNEEINITLPQKNDYDIPYLSVSLGDGSKNVAEIRDRYLRLEAEPNATDKYKEQEIAISDKTAYSFYSDRTTGRTIFIFHNNRLYVLGAHKYDLKEVKLMLSTLKFTK
jgi:hypothetical protein